MAKNHWLRVNIQNQIIAFLKTKLLQPFDKKFLADFIDKFDGRKVDVRTVGNSAFFTVDDVSVRVDFA